VAVLPMLANSACKSIFRPPAMTAAMSMLHALFKANFMLVEAL
jgi:hypothetical protein